jgi:dipeptidyl aminopeptidase/acylaminoacyl peptidase
MQKFPSIAITLILFIWLSSSPAHAQREAETDRDDMLAYVSDEGQLMVYDPRERTTTKLLDNVSNFVLSRDGRVVFTKLDEDDPDLYLFDPANPALAPINITQDRAAKHYPVAWSPDGRYLAFASFNEAGDYSDTVWIYQGGYHAGSSDQSLYVWDGEKVTNIMPDDPLDAADSFYVEWSGDGRLVFTIRYGWSDVDTPSEIYVWDGSTTTNLSQNPEGRDAHVGWNRDGQLMFYLHRPEDGGLYIWDGVSFKDGMPDADSFIHLSLGKEITDGTSTGNVIWIDDGLVAFTRYSDLLPSGTKEIVLWDLERESIVKQIPVSSEYVWSHLAEGGQVILSSHLASGIPSVYLDVENLEGEILFNAHVGDYAWSADGYLAYCGIEEGFSRLLSIWDGLESWVVARVSYKPVQWQNGSDIFSCNNG